MTIPLPPAVINVNVRFVRPEMSAMTVHSLRTPGNHRGIGIIHEEFGSSPRENRAARLGMRTLRHPPSPRCAPYISIGRVAFDGGTQHERNNETSTKCCAIGDGQRHASASRKVEIFHPGINTAILPGCYMAESAAVLPCASEVLAANHTDWYARSAPASQRGKRTRKGGV